MSTNTSELIEYFLDISVTLTGFSRFHLHGTGQTTLYFNTIRDIIGEALFAELLETFHQLAQNIKDESILAQNLRSEILGSEKLGPIARNIIKLWYVATWYELPKAWREAFGTKIQETFIPHPEAYPEGLLWPAIGVNPPGAKPFGYAIWSEPPAVSLTK